MSAKRLSALLLTALMAASAAVSCGEDSPSEPVSNAVSSSDEAASGASSAETAASGEITYPVEGNPTVTYWCRLTSNASASVASMNDLPFTAELEERTGIDVEFIHPAQGTDKESFNLLVASGDLPDIVYYSWFNGYPGGPEAAFKNRVIEPINEHMAEWAPAYTAYLAENPEVAKMVQTDEGNYPGFPFIRGEEILWISWGPFVRADWLEQIGMEKPTTIDGWYEMLTAFKNECGATAPLTTWDKDFGIFNSGFLVGAWGMATDMYLNDDGEVVYGPAQPGFKDFLAEMQKWYAEGLIDPNFYANDRSAAETNLMNGFSGAIAASPGQGLGVFEKSLKEIDPSAGYTPLQWPTLNEGERPQFGQKDTYFNNFGLAAVTASSENKEAAYALLDYAYTEEGHMLYNFGTEGVSYTMEDGEPLYTEMITNPGEGMSMSQMLAQYTMPQDDFPFVQDGRYFMQYMQLDVQKEAIQLWQETDAEKHWLPPITPTEEESKEYGTIKTNLDAWRNEWCVGAVTGKNSIDEYETVFLPELESIGLERALEIQNAALERYNNR